MFHDESRDDETQNNVDFTQKILIAYEKPHLTVLDALDVGTGGTNVPETNNGLLS